MAFWVLVLAVVGLATAVVFRRIQARLAQRALADKVAKDVLDSASDAASRQQLADVLKNWDLLAATRQAELVAHMAQHPRLEGVDLQSAAARIRAYEGLVGISPGKSPEK